MTQAADRQLEASGNVDKPGKIRLLAANPGKRRTEIIYLIWFLVSTPIQGVVVKTLSYSHYNDLALNTQALAMALGTFLLPLVFRAQEDRGAALVELYGFRMGIYLVIFAVLGGFVGTDPWYEVLHGHFAFNTHLNPNGVPLFMLLMTVSVFGFYSAILGTLYRVITQLLAKTPGPVAADTLWRHMLVCGALAPIMPLIETFAYTSLVPKNYCFDNGTGMWGLNVLVYGSWHFASLIFYTRWDTRRGERTSLNTVIVSGFATIGILICLSAFTETVIAPHFVRVDHGLRMLNDWSPHNCLGPKPS